MKSKRILLPENVARSRKPSRPKRGDQPKPAPLPFLVSQRQRSEAIGLVMIGFSAFSLSLLHFLNTSRLSGVVNVLAVNIGLGVYILPVLIGILGIQRFLERPFMNLGARLMGIAGTLFFGLGLLGLEGGKLGTFTLGMFTSRFGPVPTHLLFLFLFLASVIFALDILYKDVLAFLLTATELCARLGVFVWEAGLTGLALTIRATRQTIHLAGLIATRSAAFLQSSCQTGGDADDGGKLISFNDPSPEAQEDSLAADLARRVLGAPEPTPAPAILGPDLPAAIGLAPEGPGNPTGPAVAIACEYSLSIENVTLPGCVPTLAPCRPQSPAPTPLPSGETAARPAPTAAPVANQPSPAAATSPSQAEPSCPQATPAAETSVPEANEPTGCEEEEPEEETEDLTDSPVSLDDHPIDQQIKEQEGQPYDQGDASRPDYAAASLPPLDLLRMPPAAEENPENDLSSRSALLIKTLEDFGLRAQVTQIVEGPAVSRFEIRPAPGVKVARITSLVDDIALALSAPAIRIEAPIPGKSAMGIEIPNPKPTAVYFYDLIKNENFLGGKTLLNLALGMNISRRPVYADLAEMPHLLIAGSTGSGKSVCINTIIASILFQARADQVKLVMIDPKMVELSGYNGIPHLISPVVTDPKKAADALQWAVEEMVRRYEFLSGVKARNIGDYNRELPRLRRELDEGLEPMPLIVIIIDELADLMMTSSAQVESAICRLSQMSRAVGIHLVIATQRPSVDVLTGLIKANLPSRIAFFVSSQIDSRTIIDEKGAEKLLGKGDMLFKFKGRPMPIRVQGAYISDQELLALTEFAKSQGQPEYLDIEPTREDDDEDDDDAGSGAGEDGDDDSQLLSQIADYLSSQEKTSTSMLQRKFKIGYNRAARIMDLLEEKGMVSPLDGSNKRRVLTRRSNPSS
ncbi:MAG: DUF87 domain-containing protein [Candidatus Riflebacteria bacterium]|nr:DUF87 domain-containing protein [Candidatus Riflebacteria bacterium]